jgi:3-deoxy-D-manno-octulosonate 8-phosphate phosphatase (KDO 8-P phosphatase)
MISYKEKLRKITTFIFDVDGVLTAGEVYLFDNQVVRAMNSRDSYAIQYAAKLDYKVFIITGGHSDAVKERLENLGVTEVCLGAKNKLHVYDTLKSQYGFTDEEVVYMGDDIPDFHVMKQVGVAASPQDAAPEIKAIAAYQSPYFGGKHCVRDIIEQTLRVQNKWFTDEAFEW